MAQAPFDINDPQVRMRIQALRNDPKALAELVMHAPGVDPNAVLAHHDAQQTPLAYGVPGPLEDPNYSPYYAGAPQMDTSSPYPTEGAAAAVAGEAGPAIAGDAATTGAQPNVGMLLAGAHQLAVDNRPRLQPPLQAPHVGGAALAPRVQRQPYTIGRLITGR